MADPTNPTTDSLEDLGNTANSVGDVITKAFQNATQQINIFGTKVSDIGNIFTTLKDRVDKASKSVEVLGANKDLGKLEDPLDKLIGSFTKMQEVVDQSRTFQQFSDDSSAAINIVSNNLSGLQKIMDALHIPGADRITSLGEGFLTNAGEAEKLQNTFIGLSASAGEMNKIFDESGNLKNTTALMGAYSNSVANAADSTGLSVHQSMDFANALKEIPGALNENISTNVKMGQSTTSLISSMTLMTGTGRSQRDVIEAMNTAYENLSQSQGKINDGAQKGAEFLATISSVANGLNLKFGDVRSTLDAVAEQFKYVGNETDGAAKILARYTDALRATGLTSKSSIDIIKDMVSNISNLSTGTKAFLSLRSGGVGGLQGSFQIDQLLRNGKIDQVAGMAEKSLKQQFGGKIYTQAEAAASPEAASQFMRQRSMLQSGAFGIGKGLDDDKATRLLEALGKGDLGGAAKEIKTGNEALAAATRQGDAIQQENNNQLKIANRALERNAIAAEISAGAALKGLFGNGEKGSEQSKSVLSQMRTRQSVAGLQQSQRVGIETGSPTDADATQQIIQMGRQAIDSAIKSAGGVVSGASGGVKSSVSNVESAGMALEKLIKETAVQNGFGAPQGPSLSRDMSGDNERKRSIYNSAVASSNIDQQKTSAMIAAHMDQQNAGVSQKNIGPQKVVLEIVAPPGFNVKQNNNSSDNISINILNRQSGIPSFGDE